MGAAVALCASLAWGVSDFLGGISSRARSVLVVLAVAQSAGLVLILAAYGLNGRMPLTQGAAPWAVGAGIASSAALGLLYLAIGRGAVAVVAPLASAGVIVPVAVGLASGTAVTAQVAAGLALAIGGMIATTWSSPGEADAHDPGITRADNVLAALLAVGSAACYGLFLVLLSHASKGDPLAATSVLHLTSWAVALAALGMAALLRPRRRPSGVGTTAPIAATRAVTAARVAYGPVVALATSLIAGGWLLPVASGLADGTAEICFAQAGMGSQHLAVAAALSSLFPVVTMLLALVFLRERPGLVQGAGGVCVLAGVIALSTAGPPMGFMH